jgi:hypothetical protein
MRLRPPPVPGQPCGYAGAARSGFNEAGVEARGLKPPRDIPGDFPLTGSTRDERRIDRIDPDEPGKICHQVVAIYGHADAPLWSKRVARESRPARGAVVRKACI